VSLDACTYCDASGLSVLLRAKAVLGARLSIVVPARHVTRRIFEITNKVEPLGLREAL
jgi:hypothetical protein